MLTLLVKYDPAGRKLPTPLVCWENTLSIVPLFFPYSAVTVVVGDGTHSTQLVSCIANASSEISLVLALRSWAVVWRFPIPPVVASPSYKSKLPIRATALKATRP